jgi:hypothetical protein
MNKCPWQPLTKEFFSNGCKTTQTFFGDCLETDCPWWREEQYLASGLMVQGGCMRPTKGNPKN